jgi:hypothetical protein
MTSRKALQRALRARRQLNKGVRRVHSCRTEPCHALSL